MSGLDSIVRTVEEEYARPLPWWKWRIQIAPKLFLEPIWMFYLRLVWQIISGGLPDFIARYPAVYWYDSTGTVNLTKARNVIGWRARIWKLELIRYEYGYENREIEIKFNYWWMPADPSIGFMDDYPEWDIVSVTYCDTGKPYEGDADVWNDDIGEYINDCCRE